MNAGLPQKIMWGQAIASSRIAIETNYPSRKARG
jgi:hypothetical protein